MCTKTLILLSLVVFVFSVPLGRQHSDCLLGGTSGGQILGFSGGKKPRVHNKDVDETLKSDPPFHKPFPPKGDKHVRNDTNVLILLSAYRDPRCGQTMFNAFDRALNASRIHIGIVQQKMNTGDEFDCISIFCALMKENGHPTCPYLNNIEIVRVDGAKSTGPIWARAIGMSMVHPHHDFCMQVDAHVDFMKHYDYYLQRMWAMTENEYGILSTYVGNLAADMSVSGEVLVGHPHYEIPVILGIEPGGHNVARNQQANGGSCFSKPLMGLTWAAGWSFAKCHFERNIPNDPFLTGMFDGEEFSRYIRAWTHGYDVYTPHRPIVFHDYIHSRAWQLVREGTWNGNPPDLQKAIARYNSLVEKNGAKALDDKVFGLGSQRTLDQYIEFAGIDPRSSEDLHKDMTGSLKFVVFEEDPKMIHTKAPPYPLPLPGVLSPAAVFPLPEVKPEFIDAAREMRTMLKSAQPEVPHRVQMQEFGSPSKPFWDDLIAKIELQKLFPVTSSSVQSATKRSNAASAVNVNFEHRNITGSPLKAQTIIGGWSLAGILAVVAVNTFFIALLCRAWTLYVRPRDKIG